MLVGLYFYPEEVYDVDILLHILIDLTDDRIGWRMQT